MRLLAAAVLLVLAACTSTPAPTPTPLLTQAAPPPTQAAVAPAPTEPAPPTAAEFAKQARLACTAASAAVGRVPLQGDPLQRGARRSSRRAAAAHFRAASQAWIAAAGQLWDFGLPRRRAAQELITALDTAGQYALQTADAFAAGDDLEAQAALGATDDAMRQANRAARRLGVGPFEECAAQARTLVNARRARVVATDFAFSVAPVQPGRTRFVLRNDGQERHQLYIVRLRDPGTLDDAVREDRGGGRPSQYLRGRGTSTPVVLPGERGRVDLRLRPGPYALLCFVASPDGTPHAYKGMTAELGVAR